MALVRIEERARYIDSKRTPAGGWTRKQLAAWGVKWPPKKGWRKNLIFGDHPLTAADACYTTYNPKLIGVPFNPDACPGCAANKGETPRHIPGGSGAVCVHHWHDRHPPQFS